MRVANLNLQLRLADRRTVWGVNRMVSSVSTPRRSRPRGVASLQGRTAHAKGRQIQLLEQAETKGRAHRGGLGDAWRLLEGSETPGLGDRQCRDRRPQEARLG